MALNEKDELLLKEVYRRLADQPLEPDSQYYEPVYARPEGEDPVARLRTGIEFAEVESVQLFSGFRGSGKTTELFRLRRDLKKRGFLVLYANALDYLSPSEEVDIVPVLLSVAGAFGEELHKTTGLQTIEEGFWKRFTNYLTRTSIEVSEVTASIEGSTPAKEVLGELKAGVDLKLALKTAPSFRQKLQTFLASRLYELKAEVNRFIEEGVKELRTQRGQPNLPVVFLFDQFEQIRGGLSNEQAVIQSVERLFRNHMDQLKLPLVHVIYTVPPWLRFVLPGALRIKTLPCVRLWKNDPIRSKYESGCRLFRDAILRRFGAEDHARIFGTGRQAEDLTERLVEMSGGHFRDLLLLFRECIALIRDWRPVLPTTQEVVERAIVETRNQFRAVADEDARWLEEIARRRDKALADSKPETIARLSRFLDTHLVLYLTNGEDWYDVHPLIRDEVAALAKEKA
jgi:hypothetical protein